MIDKLNDLRRKNQTSASYTLGERINKLNLGIDNDLMKRRILLAKDKILRLADALQRMSEEFPYSSYNNDGLELKIKFLKLLRNDIELIQDRIYNNLVSIPGEPGLKLLKTEVSQTSYEMIMGYNPSRVVGILPVESVSWKQSNDFVNDWNG